MSCSLVGRGFESSDVDGLRGVELQRGAEVSFGYGRFRVWHSDFNVSSGTIFAVKHFCCNCN